MMTLNKKQKKQFIKRFLKEIPDFIISRNKYRMSNTKLLKLLLRCKTL